MTLTSTQFPQYNVMQIYKPSEKATQRSKHPIQLLSTWGTMREAMEKQAKKQAKKFLE